ncbi:MAG: hypothetical protein WC175_02935 [Candidatus Dojkabacteria bacterium]
MLEKSGFSKLELPKLSTFNLEYDKYMDRNFLGERVSIPVLSRTPSRLGLFSLLASSENNVVLDSFSEENLDFLSKNIFYPSLIYSHEEGSNDKTLTGLNLDMIPFMRVIDRFLYFVFYGGIRYVYGNVMEDIRSAWHNKQDNVVISKKYASSKIWHSFNLELYNTGIIGSSLVDLGLDNGNITELKELSEMAQILLNDRFSKYNHKELKIVTPSNIVVGDIPTNEHTMSTSFRLLYQVVLSLLERQNVIGLLVDLGETKRHKFSDYYGETYYKFVDNQY